jgi:hypothetical protein
MEKKNKNKFKKYALEAIEKLPSAKILCAIVIAILLASILYISILFFLSR